LGISIAFAFTLACGPTNRSSGPRDEAGRRHGVWTSRWPNGAKAREVSYEHGLPHGPAKGWFESGRIAFEHQWDSGRASGVWRSWNGDGTLREVQGYGGRGAEGEWGRWYAEDRPALAEAFREGRLEGERREWHPNGRLASRSTHAGGGFEGVASRWYMNGSRWFTARWVGGRRHGLSREWSPRNGMLLAQTSYVHGQIDGLLWTRNEAGALFARELWQQGRLARVLGYTSFVPPTEIQNAQAEKVMAALERYPPPEPPR
jgi:antitoxin component YwqK of YwqJK toxin-antitoxin module